MEPFVHNRKKKIALSIVNGALRLLYWPFQQFSQQKAPEAASFKTILLVRLDYIGDVVMTTPAFALVRSRFPAARIILLTNSAAQQLFVNDPRIDEVISFNWPWEHQKANRGFTISKMRELLQVIRKIRKQKPDLMIDFRGDLRFVLLFGVLTGARYRISNSRSGSSPLLHHISLYDINKHETERAVDVVTHLCGTPETIRPQVLISELEVRMAIAKIERESGWAFAKAAIVAPYSSKDVKSWPEAHFAEVISYLISKEFNVFVVGTGADREHSEELVRPFAGRACSIAGKTTIRELAALASAADLVTGVDTGVLHIASSFDVPIIAIFGPTRSVEFRPYSPLSLVVETGTCACNQFLHAKCDYGVSGFARCMNELEPSAIINAIQRVTEENR